MKYYLICIFFSCKGVHISIFLYELLEDFNSLSGGSVVKESVCKAGYQILSLDRENPLEKEVATHSSILTWRITWIEETGGLQSVGYKELYTTERLALSLFNTFNGSWWLVTYPRRGKCSSIC